MAPSPRHGNEEDNVIEDDKGNVAIHRPIAITPQQLQELQGALMPESDRRASVPRIPKASNPRAQRPVKPQDHIAEVPNPASNYVEGVLPPISGHCLCEDWTIVVLNPRPGMILCHCYDCQINSSSFFGSYISTEGRHNIIAIPQNRDGSIHEPELGVYNALPPETGRSCPRTFCRGCGTMLFAEPSSIPIVVANCGLFQNHGRHPALQPTLEIFTTQRVKWIKPYEGALQAKKMPSPVEEDDESDIDARSTTGKATEQTNAKSSAEAK